MPRKKNQTLVETQCLRLTDVKNNAQNPFSHLFEMLNQRRDQITSSFFLKKNKSNMENTKGSLPKFQIEMLNILQKMVKILRGPFSNSSFIIYHSSLK
jgi:hypothetical protein